MKTLLHIHVITMDALELVKKKLTSACSEFSEYYAERMGTNKSHADIVLHNFSPETEGEESAWEAGYIAALIACVDMLEGHS